MTQVVLSQQKRHAIDIFGIMFEFEFAIIMLGNWTLTETDIK